MRKIITLATIVAIAAACKSTKHCDAYGNNAKIVHSDLASK